MINVPSGELVESTEPGPNSLWNQVTVGSKAICFSGLSWICPHATVSLGLRNEPAQSKPGSGEKRMSQKCAFIEEPSNVVCATPKKPS